MTLIERLEGAEGAILNVTSVWLDEMREALGHDQWGDNIEIKIADALHGSLDAALALVEEKLPGWAWSVGNRAFGGQSYLMQAPGGEMISGFGSTPAIAVLIALLKALGDQHD